LTFGEAKITREFKIFWGKCGQEYDMLCRDGYIKLPKAGTNPRGVEIAGNALKLACENTLSDIIPVMWFKQDVRFNQFTRWVELWEQD